VDTHDKKNVENHFGTKIGYALEQNIKQYFEAKELN